MLSVQNYRVAPQNVAFKSKEGEEKETKPYQTHAGLKTGAALAVINTGIVLGINKFGQSAVKLMKEVSKEVDLDKTGKAAVEESVNVMKNASKSLKFTIPILVVTALGCGALVDKLINKKQADFAQKVDEQGSKEALNTEDRADTTKKGNVYYKSNTGKKIGTLLGAVAYPVLLKISSAISKIKSPMGTVGGVITGALGGLILGAITDKVANNGARKQADKQAVINE